FTVTHQIPVEPDIKGRFDALKTDVNRSTLPTFRNCKRPDILTDRIVLRWCKGRLDILSSFPGIADIGVLRVIITLKLPVGRYLDRIPITEIKILFIEIADPLVRI